MPATRGDARRCGRRHRITSVAVLARVRMRGRRRRSARHRRVAPSARSSSPRSPAPRWRAGAAAGERCSLGGDGAAAAGQRRHQRLPGQARALHAHRVAAHAREGAELAERRDRRLACAARRAGSRNRGTATRPRRACGRAARSVIIDADAVEIAQPAPSKRASRDAIAVEDQRDRDRDRRRTGCRRARCAWRRRARRGGAGGGRARARCAGTGRRRARRSREDLAHGGEAVDQRVDVLPRVVERERRARGRRHAQRLEQRLRAVVAGADGDAVPVEDRADVVRDARRRSRTTRSPRGPPAPRRGARPAARRCARRRRRPARARAPRSPRDPSAAR